MCDASKRDEGADYGGRWLDGPAGRSFRDPPFTGGEAEATRGKGLVWDSKRSLETSVFKKMNNKQLY